jgi:anthranilate phosphoribosyltransferase
LPKATLADLRGGDAKANAEALQGVLAGRKGPYRDIVLLNAAAALIVAGKAASLADGAARAAKSIDSGAAALSLKRLVSATATAD